MAKAINNLSSLSLFIVEQSVTTNLSKSGRNGWITLIFIYLQQAQLKPSKKALLPHLAGKDVKEIYKTLKTDDEEYNAVVNKLNNYFKPKVNVTHEQYVFKKSKQGKDEGIINFVTWLRSLAEMCNLLNISEAVKNQFRSACGTMKLRQNLLREKDLTLDKCIKIARNS